MTATDIFMDCVITEKTVYQCRGFAMSGDVTQILGRIEAGEPHAAEELLPFVYDELRRLAAAKMAQEKPGQTLQATALVHEAYLSLRGR